MNKPTLWRLGLIAVIIGLAAFSAYPLSEKINLGLDLQGGMHLVYEVDVDKAVLSSLDKITEDIKKFLKSKDVRVTDIHRSEENIVITLSNKSDAERAVSVIEEDYTILTQVSGLNGSQLVYAYTKEHRKNVTENAIKQALETLRNRIDEFGVAEPTIQKEGENRILIQLPGIKDRDRATKLIGRVARLEFRMVSDKFSVREALEQGAPPGFEILYGREVDPITKKTIKKIPYLVKKKVEVSGEMLASANVSISQMNLPYISFSLNKEGARIFSRLTTENVNKILAIVLDGNVYSAPRIDEPITGGDGMISGSFSYEEANDLAIVLRAGALPAPLIKLEERTVGPSLGKDSIERGLNSIIVGGVIVLVFMLVYYRFGGIIANMALIFNIIILAGALAYFGATLTLPGIAGIILTIGMAVDANVLVFERIREELRIGKTVRSAVESGFAKAFLTIIDANVTTLIAALVLFQFGTGPIKGFAITLSIGILASLFTSIYVSRTFFNWYLGARRVTKISI